MILSKWSISPQGEFSRMGIKSIHSPKRIVYLDDHKIFRRGMINSIKPFFKNMEIIEFENGDEAYKFIRNDINDKGKIDLLISDITHPGLRGQELAKTIRIYEAITKRKTRIPIILITFVDESCYPELRKDNIVDYFISKAAEADDIIDCMEEILYL